MPENIFNKWTKIFAVLFAISGGALTILGGLSIYNLGPSVANIFMCAFGIIVFLLSCMFFAKT